MKTHIRWYILALATLTQIVVVAMPSMAVSVLASEIAADLDLSVVQVGVIWGIAGLPGIVTGILAGMLGDRFGPKRVIVIGCLAVGLAGAARLWAQSYTALAILTAVVGAFMPFSIMNAIKLFGQWFPPRQLGLANGVISMGMALGFLGGALLSATVLSPWLGGWRQVFLLYGVAALLFALPWIFFRATPPAAAEAAPVRAQASMAHTLLHVARQRDVRLLGFAILGVAGGVQGLLGYLPLYLRGLGWSELLADGALSVFHLVSLLAVLPIALSSDRLGSRKAFLLAAVGLLAMGVGALSLVQGNAIWVAVALAGLTRDAFMALFVTTIIETEGVGPEYAGTAIGVVMAFSGVGGSLAPPLGNSLVRLTPQAPFIFWAALALAGGTSLALTRRQARVIAPAVT